jgi:hypothetical protein
MPQPVIRVAEDAEGGLAYAIPCPPEALPAVAPRALGAAWRAARDRARAGGWGPPRTLLFAREGAPPSILALADRDARAWAEAVDRDADLATLGGLALCLRLLALIEVMTRAAWLRPFYLLGPEGAELHPALLGAAATLPLDAGARFDAEALRRLLSRGLAARVPT